MRFDKEKRIFMVEQHHELKNYTLIQRAWLSSFKNVRVPVLNTIKNTVERFNNTGSVASLSPSTAQPSQKRTDSKNQLWEMFLENPSLSIRKSFANTGISYGMVQSILKDDLYLKPYKFHESHQLQAAEYQKPVDFAHFFTSLPKNARS